jgi:hypothetical protein
VKKLFITVGSIVGALSLIAGVLCVVGRGRQNPPCPKLDAELVLLQAANEPTWPAQFAPPPVPNCENAALVYKEAFSVLPNDSQWPGCPDALDEIQDAGESKIAQLADTLGPYLTAADNSLELCAEGASLERCRFPLRYEDAVAMIMEHLVMMKRTVKMLVARGIISVHSGRLHEAAADCRVALRMSLHLSQEPVMTSQSTHVAMSGYCWHLLDRVALSPSTSVDDLRGLLDEVLLASRTQEFMNAMKHDRACTMRAVYDDLVAKGVDLQTAMAGFPGRDDASKPRLSGLSGPTVRDDEAEYLRIMRGYIAAMDKPYGDAIQEMRRVEQSAAALPDYSVARCLTSTVVPSFEMHTIYVANVNVRIIGVAAVLYRRAHGEYPSSLADLSPEFLPEIPKDPFRGNEFLYKKTGNDFVVYSIGQDLVGDSGKPGQPEERPKLGDIVFTSVVAEDTAEAPGK